MPNWVKNIVHIEGSEDDIAKALELMRDKNVEGDIDFNNIIPMPERLNIVSGGCDKYYVAVYLNTLSETSKQAIHTLLASRPVSFYGDYAKKYRDSFTMGVIPEDKISRMVNRFKEDYGRINPQDIREVGKAYIDNIVEYGHDTWYEWCIDNWGTKWNACECTIGDDYLEFETAWSVAAPIIEELSRKFPTLTFHVEWADEDLGNNCGQCSLRDGGLIEDREFESDEEAYEFACMLWGHDADDVEEE